MVGSEGGENEKRRDESHKEDIIKPVAAAGNLSLSTCGNFRKK